MAVEELKEIVEVFSILLLLLPLSLLSPSRDEEGDIFDTPALEELFRDILANPELAELLGDIFENSALVALLGDIFEKPELEELLGGIFENPALEELSGGILDCSGVFEEPVVLPGIAFSGGMFVEEYNPAALGGEAVGGTDFEGEALPSLTVPKGIDEKLFKEGSLINEFR